MLFPRAVERKEKKQGGVEPARYYITSHNRAFNREKSYRYVLWTEMEREKKNRNQIYTYIYICIDRNIHTYINICRENIQMRGRTFCVFGRPNILAVFFLLFIGLVRFPLCEPCALL